MNFQPAASPVMDMIESLHDLLLWIIIAISAFVLALLAYACWRFRANRNPVPSRRTHNTLLEIAWTAVPVLILVIIAIPSFKLLYFMDVGPRDRADDQGDRPPVVLELRVPGQRQLHLRRLHDRRQRPAGGPAAPARDRQPGGACRSAPTSASRPPPTDVLHSWAVPQFGVKVDAVPGPPERDSGSTSSEPGIYYGQCSELCGVNHGFMPITVEAMAKDDFEAWVEEAQDQVRPRRRGRRHGRRRRRRRASRAN